MKLKGEFILKKWRFLMFFHICKFYISLRTYIFIPNLFLFCQVFGVSLNQHPIKAERWSGTTHGIAYPTWRSIFAVEGIRDSTADEGLQLMGSDIDESPGYEVVNRDWPFARCQENSYRSVSRLSVYRVIRITNFQ